MSSWLLPNSSHQRAIAFGLFERIEIGALHVFDDGELKRFGVGRLDDDDRHLVQVRRAAPRASAARRR